MFKKTILMVSIVLVMVLASVASAVEIKVDWGSQGTLDSSWTEWSSTSGSKTVNGVQFSLSNSGLNNGAKLRPWREGVGDKLIVDCLSAEDEPSGGSYTLQITNLAAGDYELVTYHNMGDAKSVGTSTATLDGGHGGASDTTNTGYHVASYTDLTEATGLTMLSFTSSGTSDSVTVVYTHTGDMPALAGFTLTLAASPVPTIQFAADSSGALETVSPAVVEVVLAGGDPAETYTVDYAVVGGSATKGDDYTLVEPATLTFFPGQASKPIVIDIIDDGVDEDDESIILELSNPTGPDAILGDTTQHTYAIRDPRVGVGFALDGSIASEDISLANIEVCLSDVSTQTVMVDYAVTGGTATPGDDYTLTAGTLTFTPGGGLCQNISVGLVDDGVEEGSETVIIKLSNPGNAKLSIPSEHTLSIQDPSISEGTDAIDLKIDIGACGGHLGPPDYLCDPSGSYQAIKEGWTDWSAWDPDLPGGEACVDWYERKTKTVGNIQMELLRVGECSDQYGRGLRFKNAGPGPLAGDGVRVNNLPNDDDPNPCGGDPKIRLTITGLPQVTSYNYIMTSWHNELGDACYSPTVTISVNGSQVVSSLPITRNEPDDSALNATYEVPGGGGSVVIEFTGAANEGNITVNGFRITDGAGASDPMPADGATDVDPDTALIWTAGQYANTHKVYLGTDPGSLQLQDHVTGNSYQPPEWLQLGTTYYWRIDEVNGAYPESPWRGPVWSFTTAGAKARSPNPADGETDVHPLPTLSWTPAPPAASHDVYLGTDPGSLQFLANVGPNSYEPGLLDFGRTYYWRIDEVNEPDLWPGDVWEFTVHDGKAYNPDPPDGANTAAIYVVLGWEAAPLADSHDVYFGTTEAAVADASTGSNEYKGNRTSTSFDPRPLSEGVTYYWRIDEVGASTRKGDVWSFTAVAPVNMQVDFALPVWTGTEQVPDWEGVPIPETLKEGWIPWCAGRWGDMYGHGTVAMENVAGTGLGTMISTVYGGLSALKVCGMCMPRLNGGTPYGSPVHDPICNSWYQVEDHIENPSGDIVMALYNLPAGKYELKSYHNNFECHRLDPTPEGTPACCDLISNPQPNMPSITALSLTGLLERYADYDGWARWEDTKRQFVNCQEECFWDHPVGSIVGNNVTTTQAAYNVPIQQVTQDSQLVPSLIRFDTDGSAVFIVYKSGCCVHDGIRPARVGGRAILNAFELRLVGGGGCACLGDVSDTSGFGTPDGKIDTGDMAKLLSELITGGGDAGNNYRVQSPSSELLLCGDLAGTDGFSAPDGQIDSGDMAKLLSHLIINGNPDNNHECGCVELP